MCFSKTCIRFAVVGPLVTTTLLGQEQPVGRRQSAEVSQLREALATQQKQLQIQEQEIQELKALLEKQTIDQASRFSSSGTMTPSAQAPAPAANGPQPPASSPTSSTAPGAGPTEPVVTTPEATAIPPFDPDQEYEEEKPEEEGVQIGPAQFRPGGYIALTGLWRSTTSGGGTGTPFKSVPFQNTALGNNTETRLSAQATRLSLRVDAPLPEVRIRRLSGYFEMDFNGTTPGTVALSSTSVGFRLRNAFAEVQFTDSWLLAFGQAFSLITPAKDQLSIWPAELETTMAVDTSYLAGFVYARLPQVRITWRPNKTFNWAFSAENPEQQVGSGGIVVFPTCCTTDLNAQYNTGSDEFRTPNLMPDLHTRIAFNSGAFHVDIGGVLRIFHHKVSPYTSALTFTQTGGGGSVNVGVKVAKHTKLIVQGAYGVGLGRYIGAMFPDVVVRPNLTINPLPEASWVSGVEQGITKNVTIAAYYSGGWAKRAFYLQPNGIYVGYGISGIPGSGQPPNRGSDTRRCVANSKDGKSWICSVQHSILMAFPNAIRFGARAHRSRTVLFRNGVPGFFTVALQPPVRQVQRQCRGSTDRDQRTVHTTLHSPAYPVRGLALWWQIHGSPRFGRNDRLRLKAAEIVLLCPVLRAKLIEIIIREQRAVGGLPKAHMHARHGNCIIWFRWAK
jgi:hypothetical protein